MTSARTLLAICFVTALGCAAPAAEPAAPRGQAVSSSAATPSSEKDRFHPRFLAAAAAYEKSYGRVGEVPQWAPTLCAAPMQPGEEVVLPRWSTSTDQDTHGAKLYFLFASDKASYKGVKGTPAEPSPVGQTIVKEAWSPREAEGGFVPGERAGLFIMMKLNKDTPGTDHGWIYGTVAADGKTVTSSGLVEACMGCHQRAMHDRLFGLPKPK